MNGDEVPFLGSFGMRSHCRLGFRGFRLACVLVIGRCSSSAGGAGGRGVVSPHSSTLAAKGRLAVPLVASDCVHPRPWPGFSPPPPLRRCSAIAAADEAKP
nr:unnamed protein product [Digitaria exilis]